MYDKMKKNRKKGRRESISVDEDLSKQGFAELKGQARYLAGSVKDLMKGIQQKNDDVIETELDYIVSKSKLMKDMLGDKRYNESINEGVVDKIDELSDVIRKEIFSIGKKDKKMGLELAKLYKKYFIEFFVRVKKMTKDSSLIETKKRDSRGTLRDYKKEYKKYGSSTKSKKYRAELNKYNRQQGTYGNGDGKDASHKGGKIVGFESQSKNRGRAEKSRLKK
jgi:hypothetical protein